MVQLKLKDATGKTSDLDLPGDTKIIELKKKAAESFNQSADNIGNIKLIYHGKLLAEDKTIESYEIKEGSIVMVMVTKKTSEQLQNDKDYEEHRPVDWS